MDKEKAESLLNEATKSGVCEKLYEKFWKGLLPFYVESLGIRMPTEKEMKLFSKICSACVGVTLAEAMILADACKIDEKHCA